MDRVLHITSPINWANVIIGVLILAVGLYKFVESPSIFNGIFVAVLVVILLFLIFAHDEVRVDSSGEGVVESKFWTLTGVKKYMHQGLAKAEAIVVADVGASDAGKSIKSFLLFADGYRLPLPGDDAVREKMIPWFQENYKTNLRIIKE